jgi:outer membrane protein OmpA-like peptidoglycan-associated protein
MRITPRPAVLSVLVMAAAPAFAPPAAAQSDPAAQALIQQLLPRTSATATRGIRPAAGGAAAAQALPTAPQAAATPPPRLAATGPLSTLPRTVTTPPDVPAAGIMVTFATGSADLTPEAMAALAPLGRALASNDLAGFRFRIEGHTDSVGARDMNQALSERRAASVRQFLVTLYGVDPGRIVTVGRGEDDLLVNTGDGVAEQRNRRVQVVNIGA